MVTVKLMGRLGNQMFQIAACIGYAKYWSVDYFIPRESADPKQWPVYFPHLPSTTIKPKKVMRQSPLRYNRYDQLPFASDLLLEGYYKSEKYFQECKEDVRKAFNIPYERKSGIVSLHVRHGDYLQLPNRFPAISLQYIGGAVEYFQNLGYKNFLVFSDGIDWCRNTLPKNFPKCNFLFSSDKTALQDLQLMSCCEHNITANSTFSWWGAWLNQNPGKIILTPDRWFGPEYPQDDLSDLLPASWIKIKS